MDYRSSNADSREMTHRNHKVVALRRLDMRRKIWMKHKVLALLYTAMLGYAANCWLFSSADSMIWKAQEVHFSLRLEVCSNAPTTNLVENNLNHYVY
jgi:hypothetical protein